MISEKCVGCTACASLCNAKAIQMMDNSEGFKVPVIEEKLCIHCKQCENVCQMIQKSDIKNNCSNRAYAIRADDDLLRQNSASGAFFQVIAADCISRGGYVCGCILDEGFNVKHVVTNNIELVRSMADSKYVQSDLMDVYLRICDLLSKGEEVLFSGTSCQVMGLQLFLDKSKCNRMKLLTIDFFCHGVPSPKIWKEYLNYYERTKKRKIVDFRFRCKEHGWGEAARGTNDLHTVYYKECVDGEVKKDQSLLARKWRQIFFSDLVLRKECYECKYATVDKPADITMGDFWKLNNVLPSFNDNKGTSLVITHNRKADHVLRGLKGLTCENVDVNKAIQGQKNAFQSSKSPKKREEFWFDYEKQGFSYVIKKYYYSPFCLFKDVVKFIRYKLHLGNL